MDPVTRYPILGSLLSPFRRSQRKTIGLLVAVLLDVAQANSLAIAGCLANWLGIRVGSAWNRLYRFLANPRIDECVWTRQLLGLFPGERLLIPIDWTEWHSNLRVLLAAVVCGTRAIPIFAATFNKLAVPRSQNCQENTFLRVLAAILREAGRDAVFLCDRGFRRVSWLALLLDLRQHFVVRLQSQVVVHRGGRSRTLRNWHLRPGQAVDLGWIPLRQDQRVRARVIGVWAPNAKEPWWLATDLADPLCTIVALYDRRMTIEEQFRDTKGCRFGLRLEWTQFRTPAYLNRFLYLLGTALALWTAVGAAAAHRDPSVQLPSKTKGPRLSLLRVGVRHLHPIRATAYIGLEFVRSYLPLPRLRAFLWLAAPHPRRTA